MKRSSLLLALALLLATAASAQHSRNNDYNDRDRSSGNYYNGRGGNNDDDNNTDYRSRTPQRIAPRRLPVMTGRAFQQAIAAVSNESFDSDKINMARFIASRNRLNTMQISAIARLLHFDSSKLEFAKCAYVSCADPEHYYLVSRVFSFSSSRKELMDYLARV